MCRPGLSGGADAAATALSRSVPALTLAPPWRPLARVVAAPVEATAIAGGADTRPDWSAALLS